MLLVYTYCVGIISSHKIEQACHKGLAIRLLTRLPAAGSKPNS
jgi:hypothetical protein